MRTGIPGNPEAEAGKFLADKGNEIGSVAELAVIPRKIGRLRGFAAQGHDVADPDGLQLAKKTGDPVPRRVHAGEVRQGIDAEFLDLCGNSERIVLAAPTGAVGNRCVQGIKGLQFLHRLEKLGQLLRFLWREKFQRIKRARPRAQRIK